MATHRRRQTRSPCRAHCWSKCSRTSIDTATWPVCIWCAPQATRADGGTAEHLRAASYGCPCVCVTACAGHGSTSKGFGGGVCSRLKGTRYPTVRSGRGRRSVSYNRAFGIVRLGVRPLTLTAFTWPVGRPAAAA